MFLNNDNEPVAKRLKIAENALNSVELPISNKEEILLEWIFKLGSTNNSYNVWHASFDCLNSPSIYHLRQNDIKQETLTHLVKVILFSYYK